MQAANFYLGAHHTNWLGTVGVPLCVSRRRLMVRRGLPRALAPWMLDSGAFSEIAAHGAWTLSAKDYAHEVKRYGDEVGSLVQVAPQDWMCEPAMVRKTGLSVEGHQLRTVANYLDLLALGVAKVFPVLQGWSMTDYMRHVEMYGRAGVYLDALPVVGIGSVCRRQGEDEISQILHGVARLGVKLHGFGVKMQGLEKGGCALHSADSMAWSFSARRQAPLPGCKTHINCANCEIYALAWRDRVVGALGDVPCANCG